MKKKYLFIFLLVILIVVGIFFYVKNEGLIPENSTEQSEQEEAQKTQLDRQEIMQDVSKKIRDISPAEPVLGGSWYVIRFWFVKDSNENFYIEYEDGHILRQILVSVEKKNDRIDYKVIGYFEPGETMWILKKGENPFLGESLELYERDEESGYWVK